MRDSNRFSDIKAGAFVLVALIVLIVGALWLSGSSVFGVRRMPYRVAMQDSGGLQPGDRVRIAGVSVGRIQRLELRTGEEHPVELVVGIRREFKIRADSTAQVATAGLMGKAYLDVNAGSPTAPLLAADQMIRGVSSPGLAEALGQVADITEKAKALLDQTTTVLDTVSREMGPLLSSMNVLLSEDNAENVRNILSSLRATTDEVSPRMTSLLARLESISAQLEGGVEGLPELTGKLSAVVDDLQLALGPGGSRLTGVLESAESGLSSAGDAMSVLGDNRGELEATMRDLRDVVSNLRAFSQHVKERPFSLVRIKAEPDRKPGQGVPRDGR